MTVLNACQVHLNIEHGEHASGHVYVLDVKLLQRACYCQTCMQQWEGGMM